MKGGHSRQPTKIYIFFLISSLKRCGPVNVLFSLVNRFDFAKFTPIIFTFKNETENSRLSDFSTVGVEVVQCAGILAYIRQLRQRQQQYASVIFHSHGIIPDFINLMVASAKRVKISTLHNFPFEDYSMTFGGIMGRLMAQGHLFIEKRLVAVACSATIKTQIEKKTGLRLLSIANGVPFTDCFVKKGSSKRFLYLGEVNHRKNVDFLLRMFALPSLSKYSLTIVGEGPLLEPLKARYHATANITFLGHVDHPEQYLRKTDYLVSASLSEGLPMAVLEGLSYGLPVLLSDIPSHLQLLNSGNFGRGFHVDDSRDFKVQLEQLLRQKLDRAAFRKNAYEQYSDVVMTKRYAALYQKLLDDQKEVLG
ncbi:glycosyltransferase [Lactiplantibacillus nangangensis]|uniref:Glycosyltransferase n=1 Tax=Lactiplantibacillus nangangensis TaxID=2559917 RepID=A0ABW1SL08_9LACO|nr:glycosyltransferase [Lactiplantibacillus nangangensis]